MLERLAAKMQGFASYKDLKELYGKVVPPLAEFEKSMQEFTKGHKAFEEMLARYDEIMAQKANKTSLIEVEKKCNEKYAKKDAMSEI